MNPPRAPHDREPLRALVGPTASGKSDLAVLVAERTGAELVSLDSMLVYRGMDVGTAKPGPDLRARAPHHLLDLVEPHEAFSVQRYAAAAEEALAGLRARGRPALLVGGTALYLKALTHGLFQGPDVDPELRGSIERRVADLGPERAHAELARVDAASAGRIHPRDRKRLVRALEVREQTGRPLSDWQREWRDGPGRPRLLVGLDVGRAELERRIRARTAAMLAGGWVEEVRRIRADRGFGPTAIQALGYAQVIELAEGRLGREEAEARIALRTRQFARRQRTWFRGFPELRALALPEGAGARELEQAAERAARLLEL